MLRRIATLSLSLFSLFAFAQTPELSTTIDENVVVTGTRFARPADDVTAKVTVIDSATIARHNNLGQLLNEQAGIVVNGAYGTPGQNQSIFLRNSANQYTLLLLDGQPLTDPSALSNSVDLRSLDLSGIERIEILRGAQSLIYGSDAVGGVINLISKKGQAGARMQVQVKGEVQSYDGYLGGANLNGHTEKLSYQLGYEYFTSEGFSAAIRPDTATGPAFDDDGAQRQSVNAGLNYRPTNELSIRPSFRYTSFEADFDGGAFADAITFGGIVNPTLDNELISPSLAVDYTKGNILVGGRYNYVASNRTFIDFGERTFKGRQQQLDVFSSQVWGDLTTTQGIQARKEDLLGTQDGVDDSSVNTISPYVQANWSATEQLSFTGGARYNQHEEFGGQFNYSIGAGYALTPTLSTRVSAASAFQSPTLDQLFGPFGPNPELEPQVSRSLEIGAAYVSLNQQVKASITGFQRNIDDVVIFNFAPGTPENGYQNQDELRDLGVEVEASAQLLPNLAVNGNLTFVSGELTTLDFMGQEVTNDEFFRRPRFNGFFGVTYTPITQLLLRATATHVGERPDIVFNPDFSSTELDLDAYTLLNLYSEYTIGEARAASLFGELRNLTDTEFVEQSGFASQGINFRLGFRANLTVIK